MALLDEFIATIRRDAAVEEVRVGPFLTGVASAVVGLATTNTDQDAPHGEAGLAAAGALVGGSGLTLARLAGSPAALERSVGFAALNSLLPVDELPTLDLNAADYLAEKGRGKRIALVGHFPFVPRLREVAAQLDVLELRPRPGDLAAEAAGEVIPAADVVAITGSALINGTIDGLLALPGRGALVMVLGPSTPLSPVWFDHGVSVISGAAVADKDTVLRSVSEGANFRQLKGVRRLTLIKK